MDIRKTMGHMWLSMLVGSLLALFMTTAGIGGEAPKGAVSPQEQLRLGERMYREGILPNGEPMQAVIKGDVSVSGMVFTCVSCHMRSGLGSVEGGVVTTPTNGRSLFRPRNASQPAMPSMEAEKGRAAPQPLPRRPAYTEASLAAALRGGIDPAGRRLSDVMPRYYLNDADMAIMVSYLTTLSAELSPGVSDKTLRLAAVIADDVSPGDVEAMLAPLQSFINAWNDLAAELGTQKKSSRTRLYARSNKISAYQRLVLSRWDLKGAPATWRNQLEGYYRKEPVFALVGGITDHDWSAVHAFSEDNRIPCLFPQTDYPVVSDNHWYTLYLSKGYYQEGEAAARYLAHRLDRAGTSGPVMHVVRDSRQGRSLSAGFQTAWGEAGRPAATTIMLQAGQAVAESPVMEALAKVRPVAVVMWDGPEVTAVLPDLVFDGKRPELLLVSSGYLGTGLWTIPEQVRDVTFITYPYRLPQDEQLHDRLNTPLQHASRLEGQARIIAKKATALVGVLNQALFAMKEDVFRDYFFDIVSMLKDLDVPLYERFSFGPGQRYASKGCHIVSLSKGVRPELVRQSDWVVY